MAGTTISIYDSPDSIGINDPETSIVVYEMFIGVGPTGATGATGPAGASGVAGKLPNSYVELAAPEGVTSATLVDIPGMSTTITLEETVEIVVLTSFELATQDGSSASTIGIAVNINGTDYDSYSRCLSGSNDTGIGAITHRSAELAAGTYTVKMRFQRTSGVSTPGVNHMDMLVMGLQGAQGADGADSTILAETTAENDFVVGDAAHAWVTKTLAQTKTILGITNAPNVATTAANDFMIGSGTVWEKKTKAETQTALGVDVKRLTGFVSNPQAVFAQRAQVVLFRAPAAITITRIHIHCSDLSPTAELAGDLKFADDVNVGGFANAAVIDVCDTTNGVVTITSGFDDATVPSGKYIYFQMDASPHADIRDIYLEVYYTVD